MLFQTSGSYLDFRDRGLLLINKYWTKCSWWLGWRDHFKSFTVVIMTWLTIKEYLSYDWPLLCFPLSWFIIGFIARVTLEEQGLVPSISPLVLSGDRDAQSFVFCVVLFRPLFVIVIFLFLLTMVLCVLSFIVSDYSFDIFKLFLALKSTTETIGSKVPKRVFSVFVCGCLFFIQFWWILSSLYYSLKSLNVICKWFCLAVTVPKIQEVKIGP